MINTGSFPKSLQGGKRVVSDRVRGSKRKSGTGHVSNGRQGTVRGGSKGTRRKDGSR